MNYKSITNLDVANKGYRNTLVISYIVLSIISVIFLLLTMFTWFRSYLDKEMKNMSLLQLNNTSQIVNTKLNTYQMILQNMFQEPIIRSSLYSDGSDSENELKISRYINSAVINDGSLDYAVLYKDGNIKQIIGPVYPNQVEQKQVVQHLLGSKNDKEVFYLQNEKNNQNRFYIFRTERDVFGEAPQRGVLFAINQRKLSNTLFSRNDPNNNYFIYDTAGNLLIQQGAHSVSLQNEVWGKILGSNSTDLQAVEHNGSDFYLISLEEKEFGLKFAQLINVSGISTTLREALGVSMLGVLFVILISSIAALFLAYFVSYPLRSFIKSLVANTDLQADNIGDNANLTKLTSEKIISEISNISRQFNSDKVLSYFEDAPAKTTPPTELQIEGSEDRLVIVYVGSTEGNVSFDNQERLLEKLRSYFGESLNIQAFTEQNSPYSIITLKGKKYSRSSIMLNRSVLKQQLAQAVMPISNIDSSLFLLMSEPLDQEGNLQATFKQLKTFAKYTLFESCDVICSIDSFTSKLDEEIPQKYFQPIMVAVKKAQDSEAKLLLPGLIEKLREYQIKAIFHALSLFASELDELMTQFTVNSKHQQSYLDHHIKLTSLINQKELNDYLTNIIEDACLEVRTFNERSLRTNMIESINYINEHYHEQNISVEQIASIFHISTSYFSRMFNEICQSTFPEYINDLRLNHSVHLLSETSNVHIMV